MSTPHPSIPSLHGLQCLVKTIRGQVDNGHVWGRLWVRRGTCGRTHRGRGRGGEVEWGSRKEKFRYHLPAPLGHMISSIENTFNSATLSMSITHHHDSTLKRSWKRTRGGVGWGVKGGAGKNPERYQFITIQYYFQGKGEKRERRRNRVKTPRKRSCHSDLIKQQSHK